MKYPRTYHLPWSPGASADDKIAKDISPLIGSYVIITEKLDGENNCLVKNGTYARSHSDFTKNPWAIKSKEIQQRISHLLSDNEQVFGENMYAIHSLEYTKLTSPFYMFGFYDSNTWSSWYDLEGIASILEIPLVPKLFEGVITSEKVLRELIDKLMKESSLLGCSEKEGIVVRIQDEFSNDDFSNSIFKYVRKNHVQTDEHWTRNWKKANIKYE